MNVFAKLLTAVRGGMREAAEVAVDAHALRIFEQEIYECESAIQWAKRDLACVVAERLRLQREIDALQSAIDEKEAQAVKAMQAGAESLARDVAELIAEKERVQSDHRNRCRQLEAHEARLQKTLRTAIQKVKDYRHELRMAKATASQQRAFHMLAANANTVGGKLTDIQDSLERIRRTQQDFADQFEAMEQVNRSLGDESLDTRLKATINTAACDPVESVLKRIQKRVTEGQEDKG